MNSELSHDIYQLPDEAFAQIIRDVELLQQGCRIHYMVDSHEIIDYCFPIEPTGIIDRPADRIADDQAALYEVFYGREARPILIPDYEAEVLRHLNYLQVTSQDAFENLDLVRALLGESAVQTILGLTKEEILKRMETEFNVLLAAAMGIFSIGVDRFKELVSTRILRVVDMPEDFVAEAHASYRETPLARAILDDLLQTLDNQRPELQSSTPADQKRKRRAVDWLLHMNKAAEATYGKTLKGRPIFTYLSSARRTERIFKSAPARRIRLKVGNEPYSIQRNRTQLLALLVCRENQGQSADWHKLTIENLTGLRSLCRQITLLKEKAPLHYNNQCSDCALRGKTPLDCAHRDTCRQIARYEEMHSRIQNLGLLADIGRYKQLVEESKAKGLRQEWCLKVLSDLLRIENIEELAIARMKMMLDLDLVDATLKRDQAAPVLPDFSAQPADMIFLPLQPVVRWPEHKALVAEIFSTPARLMENASQSQQALFDIARKFAELDRRAIAGDVGPDFNMGEHEVVRCLVFMTRGFDRNERDKGDLMALEYAEKMLSRYPALAPEFDYVIIWTACRLGRFYPAYTAANRSLKLRGRDPRFYHGRSIAALFWLAQKSVNRMDIRPSHEVSVEAAIADAQRAIELYTEMQAPARVISLQYNNIAWLRCKDPEAGEYNLVEARRVMNELLKLFPESQWAPGYPEYFHTRAFLAFEEYRAEKSALHGSAADGRRALMAQKLEEAADAIEKALKLHNAEDYAALKRQVASERRSLLKSA
jgi:hypothetical protein